jgi:mannose-1-phosphate guanylyltransferase
VIDSIPTGRPVSVERETFPGLLESGAVVSGIVDRGYWLDLGTPLAFVQGSCDLVLGKAPSPAVAKTGQSLVLDGATVAGDAVLSGGTTIGANASVASGANVDGAVVFDSAKVGANARITNSIIGEGAVIGEDCVIDGAVIGDGAVVGAGNELLIGVRVWPGAILGEISVRFSSDRS